MTERQAEEDRCLTPHEAAHYLGLKVDTLRIWRNRKTGPEYIKFGAIRYRLSDLNHWIEARRMQPHNGKKS